MGLLGKILAAPVRLVNAPARTIEDLVADGKEKEEDRLISQPLDALADNIERIDGDDNA